MIGRRFCVCAAIVVVLLATTVGLSRLQIDSSIQSMLVDGDDAYVDHERYKSLYGSDEILSIAIPFDDPLGGDQLLTQFVIVDGLESLDGVVEVSALVTQDDVSGSGNEIFVRPLFDRAGDHVSASYGPEATRERVRQHPIWHGWLVSSDLSTIAIQVELDDSADALHARDQTIREVEDVLASALNGRPYYFAGHPFMKREIAAAIGGDLARLLPLSLVAMGVALFVVFRSLRICLSVLATVLVSVGLMLGVMGWVGVGLTALTNASPTILVALATANYLHLLVAFATSQGSAPSERVQAALREVARPTLLAASTTAAGYSSLAISDVPIIREFGLSLAIGVVASAAIGLTLLPTLLSLGNSSPIAVGGKSVGRTSRLLLYLAAASSQRSRLLVSVASVVFAFFVAAAFQIEVDSSGPRRFSDYSRYTLSSQFYRDRMSGDVVENVYLNCGEGCFSDPARLARLGLFVKAATALPAVDKAISPLDYIARTFWVLRGEKGDPQELPGTAAAAEQLMLVYESSGGVDNLDNYITSNRDGVRILLRATVQSSSESARLRVDLEQLVERFLPEARQANSVISTEMLLSQAADVVAFDQLRSLFIALVLILGMVSLAFRSLVVPAALLLPNLLPIALNFGGMSLVGLSLSDSTAIIAAATVGVAVDGTVHLIFRARAAAATGTSPAGAAYYAISTAGRAVVVAGLVVATGFTVLVASEFRSVAELGILTALTMIYCVAADLLVLPAQLIAFSRREVDVRDALVVRDGRLEAGILLERPGDSGSIAFQPYRSEAIFDISECVGIDGRGRAISKPAL